ncbi:Epimerase [Beijerinckiaceae bacterium RH AL1]|nr:Epimerase [Beijerinckiaceae bacterium RH AL8]VVB42789.1 Epimerase [Beijerinckiaceae bacterium RH CH11]VVC53498.1 Epimerase [Beijerinckiaceae bacterium RH AL1]
MCEALAHRSPADDVVRLTAAVDPKDGHIALDLLDRDAVENVVATTKPDIVIHLAAQSSTAGGIVDSGDTWAVNVTGTLNLAAAICRHSPHATVLFASSSDVYGASFLRGPVSEASLVLPLSAYAKSKLVAEGLLDAILPGSNRLIIVRPFNHSGPGQREAFVLPSFAAQIARIERGSQPAELRVGDLDVSRDFMDVRDVVEAYVALIERAEALPRRFVCNIASERVFPLRHLVEMLRSKSEATFDIVVDPARLRSNDVRVARGDAGLLRAATEWRPRVSIEDLLASLLEDARRRLSITS